MKNPFLELYSLMGEATKVEASFFIAKASSISISISLSSKSVSLNLVNKSFCVLDSFLGFFTLSIIS